MSCALKIAFFGSSLLSAYWNGAATYYRGLIRALHNRGHAIVFFEPDALERQQHRDLEEPSWAEVMVYPARQESDVLEAVSRAARCDLIIKASGVGVFDELLEAAVLQWQSPTRRVAFLDVDAPATLERLKANRADPFWRLIPRYDLVLTYWGGPPVISAYRQAGARDCIPIYNALDPEEHFPQPGQGGFESDLLFMGNRLPDREGRVEEFFLRPARGLPQHRFLLGGSGWKDKELAGNVHWLGHVPTGQHNRLNSAARAVLNIDRASMAQYGFSPPTRIFEAAGAGACLISDAWKGIERFLEPEQEILLANNGEEVADHLLSLPAARARAIGSAARRHILAHHTYAHRAEQFEKVLEGQYPSEAAP